MVYHDLESRTEIYCGRQHHHRLQAIIEYHSSIDACGRGVVTGIAWVPVTIRPSCRNEPPRIIWQAVESRASATPEESPSSNNLIQACRRSIAGAPRASAIPESYEVMMIKGLLIASASGTARAWHHESMARLMMSHGNRMNRCSNGPASEWQWQIFPS